MSVIKHVVMAVALLGIAACTYPYENVNITDERPSIAFATAPSGAQVFVDGVEMGPASSFNGRDKVLQIEQGTHVVQLRRQGEVLFSETVFLGARATKTFNVR